MSEQNKIDEIKEALAAATPGPWYWHGYLKHNDVDLVSEASGHPTVMGFRRWGMNGAAPSFNAGGAMERIDEPGMVTTRKPHTSEFYQINHPDAQLIAKAPEYITYLLQENERKDEALRQIKTLIPLVQEELGSPSLRYNAGKEIVRKIERALREAL